MCARQFGNFTHTAMTRSGLLGAMEVDIGLYVLGFSTAKLVSAWGERCVSCVLTCSPPSLDPLQVLVA